MAKKSNDPELNRAYHDLKDYLAHQPKANATGRVVLHMLLNCGSGSFYWGVKTQMKELDLSRWQINKGRRLALKAGLFTRKDKRTYERTVVRGQSLHMRFNKSKEIDLGLRSLTLRIDLATRTKDGRAHGSMAELAGMLGKATPKATAMAIAATDARVDLFEPEKFEDGRHAYRPKLELVGYQSGPIKQGVARPGGRSPRYILEIEYGLHNRIAVSLMVILKSAWGLHLTESKEALTRALAKLYQAISAEREASKSKHMASGPLQVVRNYLGYLEEELPKLPPNCTPGLNMLRVDAPMFGQWRKQYLHLERIDPITGSERGWTID
jgi:hypothetical protein